MHYLIKSRDIDVAHIKHTRTSCELPKAEVITKTNSGVSRRRHNNENARCHKTVVVSNHARYHSCSPPDMHEKASGPRPLRSFCRELRLFNQQTDDAARKHMVQDRLPRPTNKQVAVYCISYQEID